MSLRSRPKAKIWYTREGEGIQLRQMSVEHIHRALALIEAGVKGHRYWRTDYFIPLRRELRRREETRNFLQGAA